MGAPTGARASNIAQTRETILQSAIDQFSQHGYAGARVDAICAQAQVSQRMVYHYFGDKDGLYVAVLEHVLGQLRAEELKLDLEAVKGDPLAGLMHMFAFTFDHFARHPELIRLLSAENLLQARFLKNSVATPTVAAPVLDQLSALIRSGEAAGTIRAGLDPLHLYVTMVGLSYFHKSNGFTLAHIFGVQVLTEGWQKAHYGLACDMLRSYLEPPATERIASRRPRS